VRAGVFPQKRESCNTSLFVASALDTLELIGQFESKSHAEQACARDFARRKAAGSLTQPTLGSRAR
jgi:hypothetical protein